MRGSAGDSEQAADRTEKQANRLVSRERAANEHGFGDLKNWRVLTKPRLNAKHAVTLGRGPGGRR
ncbi:hypothetical protein [Streptomyces sp. NPDC002133]|uniref:hypothetical protein n=1 Tax=Streptomyces sp. NPDC002133 TaxID=3154409 RepID=UPI00331C118A